MMLLTLNLLPVCDILYECYYIVTFVYRAPKIVTAAHTFSYIIYGLLYSGTTITTVYHTKLKYLVE